MEKLKQYGEDRERLEMTWKDDRQRERWLWERGGRKKHDRRKWRILYKENKRLNDLQYDKVKWISSTAIIVIVTVTIIIIIVIINTTLYYYHHYYYHYNNTKYFNYIKFFNNINNFNNISNNFNNILYFLPGLCFLSGGSIFSFFFGVISNSKKIKFNSNKSSIKC